jgi:Fe-S-cluster containining protein
VVLDFDVYAAVCERARAGEAAHDNDRFIAGRWHPIGAWRDDDGVAQLDLRCDAFDPATRLCTAHEDRPPVCRGYPWYGEDPAGSSRALALYPECSYLIDAPPSLRPEGSRPLIPLTVAGG